MKDAFTLFRVHAAIDEMDIFINIDLNAFLDVSPVKPDLYFLELYVFLTVHVCVCVQAISYKLDADSRKLRGDVESRGPWSCSVPSAARTLLQGPRLSKTPRSFLESASS